MNKLNSLSKDIVSAVKLFAEFGSRGEYIRKGKIIIVNDVKNPEAEGIFLARCARKIAKREGVEYAHEWALKAFTDNVYAKNERRNQVRESARQKALSDMALFGAKTLVSIREKTGTTIKQAYSL